MQNLMHFEVAYTTVMHKNNVFVNLINNSHPFYQMQSLGILYALISMLGFGLGNSISPIAIRKIGAKKSIFYRNLFTSIMFLLLFIIIPFEYEITLKFVFITVGIGLLGFIPLWTFFKAQRIGKIGIINPIANSSVLFTIIFSFILYGEKINIFQGFSMFIILLGIILSSVDFNDFKNSEMFDITRGVPLAVFTSLMWGIVFVLFKIPVNVFGPVFSAFLIEFAVFIPSAGWLFFSKNGFSLPDKKTLFILFFVAVFGVFGLLFFNLGIQIENVGMISAIVFANPIIGVLFGKFYFKDTLRKSQYFAIALLIVGIILIGYFS